MLNTSARLLGCCAESLAVAGRGGGLGCAVSLRLMRSVRLRLWMDAEVICVALLLLVVVFENRNTIKERLPVRDKTTLVVLLLVVVRRKLSFATHARNVQSAPLKSSVSTERYGSVACRLGCVVAARPSNEVVLRPPYLRRLIPKST